MMPPIYNKLKDESCYSIRYQLHATCFLGSVTDSEGMVACVTVLLGCLGVDSLSQCRSEAPGQMFRMCHSLTVSECFDVSRLHVIQSLGLKFEHVCP